MKKVPRWPVGIVALSLVCLSPAFAHGAEKVEKEGWKWSRLNPFRIDDTQLTRPASSRKIATSRKPAESRKIVPNRFKPTRSATKPKRSPWQVVSDSTRKMVDGTRNALNIGGSKKTDSALDGREPAFADKPADKKKTSYTSWLPWSKSKKR